MNSPKSEALIVPPVLRADRVSSFEKAVFERAAQLKGMSVSTLLRTSARREAARILMMAGKGNPFMEADKSRRPRRKT